MENPKRARGRKRRRQPRGRTYWTGSAERQPGGQGVGREAESEGHEEKLRAAIEGATPRMNRSAKAGARSSPHYGAKAFLPTLRTKVFADGTERKAWT